ncbi:histidine kinase, partial [Candidatus Magnetomorum sp. HK-1]
LDASVANCIYQDKYQSNITWVGTQGGLICVDFEKNMQHFYRCQLPAGKVQDICQLFDHSIWIATTNGLARFDPDTSQWAIFNTQNSVITENNVQALATPVDKKKLWIGTMGGGIFCWDAVQKNWSVFSAKNSNLPTNHIQDITIDSQGNPWVATHRGLAVLNLSTNQWQVFSTENSELSDNVLNVVRNSSDGHIWVGTWNQGIADFDPINNEWKHYNSGNSLLTTNYIDNLVPTPSGDILIPLQEKGLFKLNPSDDSWHYYTKSNTAFPSQSVFSVIPGVDNSLIVSVKDYLLQFDDSMNLKNSLILIQRHLPDNDISCITQSKRKNLWLGFRNHGLIRFNPDIHEWSQWHPMNSPIPAYDVRSIVEMSDGQIVLGTANGLAFYNENSRIWSVYQTQNSDLPDNDVTAVLYDKNGYLWVGTSNGVAGLNPSTLQWKKFISETDDINEHITCLSQTTDGRIWAGTSKNGLLGYKENENLWEIVNQGNSDLSDNHIQTILGTQAGKLWIATLYDGLTQYNFITQSWTNYNTSNSALLFNNIAALTASPDGVLWIGDNNKHLYRFHPLTLEWHTIELNENSSDMTSIVGIVANKEDDLWVGTQDSGLFHLEWPRSLESPGALIVVQGEDLLLSTQDQQIFLENIYCTFSKHEFQHKDIMMIASSQTLDFNGDGISDSIVDTTPDAANIRNAILNWSVDKYSPENPLFIFILGQWSINADTQMLELHLPNNQRLSALELHNALSLYEQETGGQIIIVINNVDGSQILDHIASHARIVITDGQIQTDRYKNSAYGSFLHYFLAGLEKQLSVYESFINARKQVSLWQHKGTSKSYLDDNGDGLSDLLDGIFANQIQLKTGQQERFMPKVQDIDFSTIQSDSIALTAVFNMTMAFANASLHYLSSEKPSLPLNISMTECRSMTFCGEISDITPTGSYELIIMGRDHYGRMFVSEPSIVNIGLQQYGGLKGQVNILLGQHEITFNETRLEVHLSNTEYEVGIHPDGTFSFEKIPEGTYQMEIIGPDFYIHHSESILITAGDVRQLSPVAYDIASSWCSSDVDCNGIVDLKDIIILLQKLVNGVTK